VNSFDGLTIYPILDIRSRFNNTGVDFFLLSTSANSAFNNLRVPICTQSINTVLRSSRTCPTIGLDNPCFLNLYFSPFIVAIRFLPSSSIESHQIVDANEPLPVSNLASSVNSFLPTINLMSSL